MKTVRVEFPLAGEALNRPKLDDIFANAEKWSEWDIDDDRTVEMRFFVRHPKHTACTMTVKVIMTPMDGAGPGVSRGKVERIISDDGRTPLKALGHIAQYSVIAVEFAKRGGGPQPTPDGTKLEAVLGWREAKAKGRQTKCTYARGVGVSASTLYRWEKELEEKGKL